MQVSHIAHERKEEARLTALSASTRCMQNMLCAIPLAAQSNKTSCVSVPHQRCLVQNHMRHNIHLKGNTSKKQGASLSQGVPSVS